MTCALTLARAVLAAGDPAAKVAAAERLAQSWAQGLPISRNETAAASAALADHPARPPLPALVAPNEVKRRRLGSEAGRAALLHAVAHIEFNAIDLAADMLARFGLDPRIEPERRHEFCTDWISVCADEARHFTIITKRMADMNVSYGDLPAHNGLWEAAFATKDNFAARLAIAPLVLEARGLDVTPTMIGKLEGNGDSKSADVLQIIYDEEVRHVAIGRKWFAEVAKHNKTTEIEQFHALVQKYFKGQLKPPFNVPARTKARLPRQFYEPLAVTDS
jgi:uncharacterized ferritin-like protein (DUF455 family)